MCIRDSRLPFHEGRRRDLSHLPAAAATPGNGKTPVAKRTRGAGKEADDGGLGKMMAKASVPRGPKR